jgi:hypothetical protein
LGRFCSFRGSLEKYLNFLANVGQFFDGVEISHNFAFAVDEELGEVPGDHFGGMLALIVEAALFAEIFVDRVQVAAVDIHLLEKGELGLALASHKALNFFVLFGFLMVKLV